MNLPRPAQSSRIFRLRGMSLLTALCAAGCGFPDAEAAPNGVAAPDMDRPGPVLVAEVLNRSDQERVLSYEFEAADRSSTGSGEGLIPACTAMVESWAEITGSYVLRLDDEVLVEDRLVPGQGDDAFLVVRVQVGEDGSLEVVPPALVAAGPELGSRPILACG